MANTVKMEIELDGKDALKTIKAIQDGFKETEKETKKVSKEFSVFGDVFKAQLSAIVAIDFGNFLRQQFSAAIQGAIDFEVGLVNVAKTANLSAGEVEVLAKNIDALAKDVPATTNELLEIATAAGQLGVTGTGNITKFADTIAKLGRVSDISGDEAATSLTRILNVTQENIGTIDTFASVIVSLGNNFAATESEIIAVTNEVARATAQFGVTSSEAAALSTALRAVGVRAEEAGGVLSKTFIAIGNSIDAGGKKLRELEEITGLTGDQIRKQFSENATLFFRNFVAGLDEVRRSGGNVNTTLASLGIEGIRVSKVIPVLASNISEFDRALALANAETKNATALQNEFEKAADTTASKLQIFKNTVAEITRDFVSNFTPATDNALEIFTEFLQKLTAGDDVAKAKAEIKGLEATLKDVSETTDAVNSVFGENSFLGRINRSRADSRLERINALIDEQKEKLEALAPIDPAAAIKDVEAQIKSLDAELKNVDPILGSIFGSEEELEKRKANLQAQLENLKQIQAVQNNELLEAKKKRNEDEANLEAERFNILNALREEQKAFEDEQKVAAQLEKELGDQEEFIRLQNALGKETAAKELARIQDISDEKRRQAELKKVKDKARKEEKASLVNLFNFEKATNTQKVAAQRQTLQTLASINSGGNSALFAVSKAASLSLAGINIAEGVTKALALGPILGPVAAGAIAAAGAIQIAQIVAAKPPPKSAGSFQSGGLITGASQTGDRLTAQVNAGETILNRRQSERVFRAIDEGNIGGGGVNVNISNPMFLSQDGVDEIIDQINDAIEFRNKELRVA